MAATTNTLPQKIRVDPELARLCVALALGNLARLWFIARAITRAQNGSGCIQKSELKRALKRYDCAYTDEHVSRLLTQGEGVFWNRDHHRLFIRKPAHVVVSITQQALATNPDMIYTNRPGCRDMYVDPSGTLERWEVSVYTAWLAHRQNPTISRQTLAMLFQRDETTLRRWERDHLRDDPRFYVQANYAQSPINRDDLDQYDLIPDHAQEYAAQVGSKKYHVQIRATWQLPNTYGSKRIRQHPKRGQGYKTRAIVNQLIADYRPITCGQPPTSTAHQPTFYLDSFYTIRRYFDYGKTLKQYLKKGKVEWGYLWRGATRYGQGILEPSRSGYGDTKAGERLPFKHEYAIFKSIEERRQAFIDQWKTQNNDPDNRAVGG